MKAIAVFLAVVAVLFSPVSAADNPTIFDHIEGHWQAEGTAFGAPSTSDMIWDKTLDGHFYHVDYRIKMQRGDRVQTFHGIGYYRATDGATTSGFWADNSGDLHRLNATLDDNRIETIWGEAGGKQGRTHYILRDDGRVEVTDWLLTGDGWKQFNTAIFTRIAAQ